LEVSYLYLTLSIIAIENVLTLTYKLTLSKTFFNNIHPKYFISIFLFFSKIICFKFLGFYV
jgi:hypothetical protein